MGGHVEHPRGARHIDGDGENQACRRMLSADLERLGPLLGGQHPRDGPPDQLLGSDPQQATGVQGRGVHGAGGGLHCEQGAVGLDPAQQVDGFLDALTEVEADGRRGFFLPSRVRKGHLFSHVPSSRAGPVGRPDRRDPSTAPCSGESAAGACRRSRRQPPVPPQEARPRRPWWHVRAALRQDACRSRTRRRESPVVTESPGAGGRHRARGPARARGRDVRRSRTWRRRYVGVLLHAAQHVQDGGDAEIVGECGMSLTQQVGGDRPGWFLRPVGHQLPPVPQCPPGLGERGAGDQDGRAVGMAEQQHPQSQRIASLRGGCVRGAWASLVRGCRADLADIDPYPAGAVLLVGAVREHVHFGRSARCLTRIVSTDGGRAGGCRVRP